MKTIQLTKDYFATVDDEDYRRLSQFKWYAEIAQSGNVYAARKENQKRMPMANEILGLRRTVMVDHISGDTLDNRTENLRQVTKKQNCLNKRQEKNKVGSQYKGVSYLAGSRHVKRWFARITKDGKTKVLGSFETEIEAARAYDIAAKELHGEYAKINNV